MDLTIRDERPTDLEAISELTRDAFRSAPFASGTEHHIIEALRAERALTVSLVATREEEVVGHVAFSPVTLNNEPPGWYALGPIAVRPAWQGRGIGSRLVNHGLQRLQELGAAGCVLVGDPRFYGRFGFAPDPRLQLDQMPPSASLVRRFGRPATGLIRFHSAFFRSYRSEGDAQNGSGGASFPTTS